MSLLAPGTRVRVTRVDPYGLQGREPHPPTGRYVSDSSVRPVPFISGPCDNREALVVRYVGWLRGNGDFWILDEEGWNSSHGEEMGEVTPEIVYNAEVLVPFDHPDDEVKTHLYQLVVEGVGVFEFADYEFVV
jgi:hypothetical protein